MYPMNDELIKLASCEDFKKYCKALTKGNDVYKDLIIEVVLVINEMDNVINIKQVSRAIAWKKYNNKYDDFFKKYRNKDICLSGVEVVDENTNIDNDYLFAIRVIDKDLLKSIKEDRFPVQYELFKTYLELKTYRAVSKFYDIPRSTVHRLITEYKQRIKNETINTRTI